MTKKRHKKTESLLLQASFSQNSHIIFTCLLGGRLFFYKWENNFGIQFCI